MFNINGILIKSGQEYRENPRTKITTTIRRDYWNEYKNLMGAINEEYCKGFDIMLEMLSEDEELLSQFVSRVRKY